MRTQRLRGTLPRLDRLEGFLPDGCDRCRTWDGVTLGNMDGSTMRPERCPVCQRRVPITMIRRVVGVDWEDI